MKTIKIGVYGTALAALFLCGCATTEPQGNARPLPLKFYSKAELEDMDGVRLPSNYSVKNFRKLQMAVAFNVQTKEGVETNPGLAGRLQTEMAKLKRFTIFSAQNRDGVMQFQQLSDLDDEVKMKKATTKDIDMVLNVKVMLSKETNTLHNEKEIIYVADMDANCEDLATRTVKFSEKARGVYGQKLKYSLTGVANGAIDPDVAVQSACLRALAILANKLGNTFPVGGRVKNISGSGETMVMGAGFEEGVGANQQVAVFLSEDGLDIPLAFAEATPKDDGTSALNVYKWNTGHRDAKPIIKELQENPRAFLKNYKGDEVNGLFAVAFGMAVPPDWEKNANK